jgi:hypothetical protein
MEWKEIYIYIYISLERQRKGRKHFRRQKSEQMLWDSKVQSPCEEESEVERIMKVEEGLEKVEKTDGADHESLAFH